MPPLLFLCQSTKAAKGQQRGKKKIKSAILRETSGKGILKLCFNASSVGTVVLVKAHTLSRDNLSRHISRHHSSSMEAFEKHLI
uniref:Uncharacterized protein n=1 Tax=Lepeophtheirus salmonis TaxID=72036 RepID=A0A0K2UE22_LEPSM